MIGIYKITNKINEKSYIGRCTMITYINDGEQYVQNDTQYPIRSAEENIAINKEYSVKKNSGNNSYKHIINEEDLPTIISFKKYYYFSSTNSRILRRFSICDYRY